MAHVRSQGAAGLGKIGSDATTAVPLLIQALTDKDDKVRRRRSMHWVKSGRVRRRNPALIEALQDGPVRVHAAQALGKIGSDRSQ